jgi:hypothetical protein
MVAHNLRNSSGITEPNLWMIDVSEADGRDS